jgi:hypothetical protein
MIDPPASAAAASEPQSGYFCAACKRRHEGWPYGSVGTSLDYCEPAITHLLGTGVIEKQDDPLGRRYSLRRDR